MVRTTLSLSLGTTYLFPHDSATINSKYLCHACYFAGELPTSSRSNHIPVCVHCYAAIQPTFPRFPLTSTAIVQSSFTRSSVALIDYYRSDEYENAVVPVVLAHKFTAISAGPGGAMIDALVSSALAP